jgi:hypothetical protein
MQATWSQPVAEEWDARQVALGSLSFSSFSGVDCMDRIVAELSRLDADRFVVVTDDTVLGLHQDGLVPELYTKAVEQLGHAKAPVRLSGLYALRDNYRGQRRRTFPH